MSKRRVVSGGWKKPLAYRVRPKDHPALRTLADARRLFFKRGDDANLRPGWQRAIALTMTAADTGRRDDIKAATDQVRKALFLSLELELDPETQASARPGGNVRGGK